MLKAVALCLVALLFCRTAAADIREMQTTPGAALSLGREAVFGCSDAGVAITVEPEFGSLTAGQAGLVYRPGDGFSGSDSFEYRTICAGGNTGPGPHFILVTVAGANPPDLSLASSTRAMLPSGKRLIFGDAVQFGCATQGQQATVQPDHGSLTLRGSAVIYAPLAGFIGIDSLETYQTCNGQRSAAAGARFQIIEVEPPQGTSAPEPSLAVVAGDSAILEAGQSALLALAPIVGCDLQGSQLLAAPAHGTASARGSALLYTPFQGFAGADEFSYLTVCAGQPLAARRIFRVTVKPPKPQYRLALTLTGSGSGRVASDPGTIDCQTGQAAGCSAAFRAGTVVNLTAIPANGAAISAWSGACVDTGNGTSRVALLADALCTLRFDRPDILPESGWWWSSAEPGTGYGIEVRAGTLLLVASLYRGDGSPVWYLAQAPLVFSEFSAPLREFVGGQAPGKAWRAAEPAVPSGSIRIAFDSAATATATLVSATGASRSARISRFALAAAAGGGLPEPVPQAAMAVRPVPVRGGARPIAVEDARSPRVIVRLRPAVPAPGQPGAVMAADFTQSVAVRQAALGSAVAYASDVLPWLVLKPTDSGLQSLLHDPAVERVSEERWLRPTLRQSIPRIGADRVWKSGAKGQGRTVAILDTGVDAAHPFFGGRVVAEACFSTSGAGMVSLCANGGPFEEGSGSGLPCDAVIDGCYHGTHVAGIAAGSAGDISGAAPAARIAALKVFAKADASLCGASGACLLASDADIMMALDWVYRNATALGIAAVNLSLGGGASSGYCDGEPIKLHIDALRRLGVATVIAAGNDGDPARIGYPACVSSAIAVGAVTKADWEASYTDRWALPMLLAPGDGILSSMPGGGFGVLSGTSMAAPHVTGSWALLQSALLRSDGGGADVDRIQAALTQTGKRIVDPVTGFAKPRIDVAAAYAALLDGAHAETGWWWNPDQPGTGYFLEVAGGQALLSLLSYAGDGSDAWLVSAGPMQSASLYQGPLMRCGGGQTLSGAAQGASCSAVGTIAVQFETATKASVLFADGTRLAITRFAF